MNTRVNKKTIIIKQKDAPDLTVELAKYLDVLGSTVRLKIIRLLDSNPMDIEFVSHMLWKKYGKISSRENTKKHIDKLLEIGLVKKIPGIRDNRAVINYMLVPGAIEMITRTLSKVMKFDLELELNRKAKQVNKRINEELAEKHAVLRVLNGLDDGREFFLKKNLIRIGRIDPENTDDYDSENDVILSDSYEAVTRVSKPHAVIVIDNEKYYIEHCEGINSTYLWNRKLEKHRKIELNNGDMIYLAKGEKGARFVFLSK